MLPSNSEEDICRMECNSSISKDNIIKPECYPSNSEEDSAIKQEFPSSTSEGDSTIKPEGHPSTKGDSTIKLEGHPNTKGDSTIKPEGHPSTKGDSTIKPESNPSSSEEECHESTKHGQTVDSSMELYVGFDLTHGNTYQYFCLHPYHTCLETKYHSTDSITNLHHYYSNTGYEKSQSGSKLPHKKCFNLLNNEDSGFIENLSFALKL